MSRVRAWLVAGVTLVLATAAVVLSFVMGTDLVGFSLSAVLLTAVGAYLLVRVPHNVVGAVLTVGGAAWLLYTAAGEYARLSLEAGPFPGEYLAAWLGSWTGALLPASLAALMLTFPNGRPPSRWRWLGLVLGIVVTMALIGGVLLWGLPVTVLTDFDSLDLEGRYLLVDLAFIGGFISTIPAALSLISRYRRGDVIERQQVKWLLASAVLLAAVVVFGIILTADTSTIWEWALSMSIALMPVAVAFAIFRYRLYEIDRIISRTVTYALVVGLLGAVVLGLVAALALFLPSDDPLVVALATLAVFALFNPVRRRVQHVVDRRFNRSHYDAARVIDDFTGGLRDRVDPVGVVDDWVDVVETTMQPTTVGVWVRE